MKLQARILILLATLSTTALALEGKPSLDQALHEISNMSQQQCRGAFYLNTLFYSQTKEMTEQERREFFPKFRAQIEAEGYPAPRPPPPPDSPISLALKKCAEGY